MKVVVASKLVAQKHEASTEVEEKPFPSSFVNSKKDCRRKGKAEERLPPLTDSCFPADSRVFHLKTT